jgi:hypothetical protein
MISSVLLCKFLRISRVPLILRGASHILETPALNSNNRVIFITEMQLDFREGGSQNSNILRFKD